MIELPQELIYEIISHLPKYYPKCTRACSLVARSWTRPSQERLFEEVDIYERNLQSWLRNVSPTNVELLGHVRSLSYIMNAVSRKTEPPHRALRDYLPSFRQLRHLVLSAPVPLLPQRIEIFSAFQHTLLHISLSNSSVTIGALITVINYFPNLASLDLNSLHYDKEDGSIPPLLRPPPEKLSITEPSGYDLDIFDELSELGLRFNELDIDQTRSTTTWPEFAKCVIDAFGASAKRLRLLGPPHDVRDTFTLSHCRELREVEIFTSHPTKTVELNLIPSITSMNIQTIILTRSSAHQEFSVGRTYWKQLDQVLCKLADRPQYKHRLRVEFQSVSNRRDEQPDLRKCLPRFHEKGRVRVVGIGGGLIYCSDGKRRR